MEIQATDKPAISSDLQTAADRLYARIAADREKWLTKEMKKLLPNNIFAKIRKKNFDDEVTKYLADEEIKLVHGDLGISIMVKGKVVTQWKPAFKFKKPEPKPEPLIIQPDRKIIITG